MLITTYFFLFFVRFRHRDWRSSNTYQTAKNERGPRLGTGKNRSMINVRIKEKRDMIFNPQSKIAKVWPFAAAASVLTVYGICLFKQLSGIWGRGGVTKTPLRFWEPQNVLEKNCQTLSIRRHKIKEKLVVICGESM